MSVMAKSKESYKCTLTLLNGKTVSGYIVDCQEKKFGDEGLLNLSSVNIADTPDGKGTEYSADESKSLTVFLDPKNPKSKVEFLSLYPTKKLTSPKSLKPAGHRCFWWKVFDQKGILGFYTSANSSSLVSMTPQTWVHNSAGAYCYCLKGDEVVVNYYVGWSKSVGYKAYLKSCFARFPKMEEYLKSDDFNWKDFKKDPISILKKLETLK